MKLNLIERDEKINNLISYQRIEKEFLAEIHMQELRIAEQIYKGQLLSNLLNYQLKEKQFLKGKHREEKRELMKQIVATYCANYNDKE